MSEQVGDGHERLTPREQAKVYLLHAEHAQSQAGMQTFYLAAIAHLLRSIDDKLTPPVESDHDDHETHYFALEGLSDMRVFHSTDEVIDFLLNDHEETR
jgi:hypothetical protein